MTHWVYLPEFSGAALQGHRLAKELQQLGVSIQVLTGTHEKGLIGVDEVDGILVNRVLRNRASISGSARYWMGIHRFILKQGHRFDLVHNHGFQPRVNLAAHRLGLPIVTKITNQTLDDPSAVAQRRFGRLQLGIFNMTDAVIATSTILEESCRKSGLPAEKIVRIPNGVDTLLFSPLSKEKKDELRSAMHAADDKIVLLSVGAVEYRKGFDALVRAIYELDKETRDKIRLWIVGPTSNRDNYGTVQPGQEAYVDRLLRMIKEFGLEDIVLLKGRQQNIHEYMRAADIYIHPSRMEGQPNAILEAMSTGLPVIANLLPGITDEILQCGRFGYLIDAEDAPKFASALRVLINNEPLRKRIGGQAQDYIHRHYSIKQTAQRHLSLYSSLVHRSAFETLKTRSRKSSILITGSKI